jgi:hypothetical protein
MKKIIYYQKTHIPDYLITNIENTLKLHKNKIKIYLLTDQDFKHPNVITIDISNYPDYNLKYQDGFWKYTILRFFGIKDFLKKSNLKKVFHIENDVLLYTSLDKLYPQFKDTTKLNYPVDNQFRGIASFLYIPDFTAINDFCNFILNENRKLNDMELLGLYQNRIVLDIRRFDSCAIGQYIAGTHQEPNIPFENETSFLKVKNHKLEEKKDAWYLDDKKVHCIHWHSKDLHKFTKVSAIDS